MQVSLPNATQVTIHLYLVVFCFIHAKSLHELKRLIVFDELKHDVLHFVSIDQLNWLLVGLWTSATLLLLNGLVKLGDSLLFARIDILRELSSWLLSVCLFGDWVEV
jgi:hypothetical protein